MTEVVAQDDSVTFELELEQQLMVHHRIYPLFYLGV